MKASSALVLFLGSVLAGCSPAGFGEGYGPKGRGLISSAYGYEDAKITDNQWYVAYTDVGVPRAMQKAHRRAKELCSAAGFADYDFSTANNPRFDPTTVSGSNGSQVVVGGLTTVAGEVTCSNAN